MKRLLCYAAVAAHTAATARAQSITAAEYFIDTDPGPGNGTAFSIPTPGTTVSRIVNVPAATIAALSVGSHLLTARMRDADGDWSVAFTRPFYREAPPAPPGGQTITAAEYYIDTDPGPGNGTAFSIPTPGTTVSRIVNVPAATIAALSVGSHLLTARMRDAEGDWSVAFTRPFYKEDPGPPQTALLARVDVRWFQNNAPVSSVVSLTPPSPANPVSFQRLASLAGLLQGQSYQLVLTPFDSLNRQGISATRTILVQTTDTDGDGIPDQWEITHNFDPNNPADMQPAVDSDGDGVPNREEFTRQINPRLADTDGDGMNDRAEIDLAGLGFDPKVNQGALVTALRENANNAGLYSKSQFQALTVGRPLLERNPATGQFTLSLALQQSANLTTFTPFPLSPAATTFTGAGTLEYRFASPSSALFYRVSAAP